MNGYSISQVARRTGFPASTLRFYERSGLVRPQRTGSGYRSYDDRHVEQLLFIGRAKGFGLSLDEITEVMSLLRREKCAPAQGRLRDLVEAKISGAQAKTAELIAFTSELRRVAEDLAMHTPDGPCDESCGCVVDRAPVAVVARRPTGDGPAIACTLSPDRRDGRVDRWRSVADRAAGREPIPRGVRLRFEPGVDVVALAALAAIEHDCCRFFTFSITIDTAGVALDVTGPDDARPLLDALVGIAA